MNEFANQNQERASMVEITIEDKLKIDLAVDCATAIWNVSEKNILTGGRRFKEYIEPRQAIMFYLNRICGISQKKSAEIFGLNHSTCVHSNKCVVNFYNSDREYKKKIKQFVGLLGVSEQQFIFSMNN